METTIPFGEVTLNKDKSKSLATRSRKKKNCKVNPVDNLTISAWSTKSINAQEGKDDEIENRYEHFGEETKKKIIFRKKRHFSEANPLRKIKMPLEYEKTPFIPDYVFKRQRDVPKTLTSKQKYFPLKQTSINYETSFTEEF